MDEKFLQGYENLTETQEESTQDKDYTFFVDLSFANCLTASDDVQARQLLKESVKETYGIDLEDEEITNTNNNIEILKCCTRKINNLIDLLDGYLRTNDLNLACKFNGDIDKLQELNKRIEKEIKDETRVGDVPQHIKTIKEELTNFISAPKRLNSEYFIRSVSNLMQVWCVWDGVAHIIELQIRENKNELYGDVFLELTEFLDNNFEGFDTFIADKLLEVEKYGIDNFMQKLEDKENYYKDIIDNL